MNIQEIIYSLEDTWLQIHTDLFKAAKGNKKAAQRVRVASIYLEKILKDFRKKSMEM